MPKPKNIIIFSAIAVVFISIYVFFIRKPADTSAPLVSSSADATDSATLPSDASGSNSQLAQDFLKLLLNVKTIKLNDTIFSDAAFMSLRDSSIVLTPDGSEGRPNPFAPLGVDNIASPLGATTSTSTPPQAPASTPPASGTPPRTSP